MLYLINCLTYLVLVYEKEVVSVLERGAIVAKINVETLSYKRDSPTAKSDMSQKEKPKLETSINWIYCVKCYWRNKDKVDRNVSV